MSAILDLLNERGRLKSICPSEIFDTLDKHDPDKMERARCAARLLCHQKKIEILQKGKTIDPNNFKGPIRLRLSN